MKRYRFSLEAVLRLRRMEEEQARERLQIANAALRAQLARREAERERYREVAAVVSGTSLSELCAERLFTDLSRQRVTLAERAVDAGVAETALAQVDYRRAATRVDALERLEGRQRAEHAVLEAREAAALVDDIVTARYIRDRAANPGATR